MLLCFGFFLHPVGTLQGHCADQWQRLHRERVLIAKKHIDQKMVGSRKTERNQETCNFARVKLQMPELGCTQNRKTGWIGKAVRGSSNRLLLLIGFSEPGETYMTGWMMSIQLQDTLSLDLYFQAFLFGWQLSFPGGASGQGSRDKRQGPILGSGRTLEEETATQFIIFFWRISWTQEPGGLYPMVLQRVRYVCD